MKKVFLVAIIFIVGASLLTCCNDNGDSAEPLPTPPTPTDTIIQVDSIIQQSMVIYNCDTFCIKWAEK